jgi:two-component system OmpR family sensor kinase
VTETVVVGDHDRLRQVVDNLLANIRAHTPPATPAHVRVVPNGELATVEVADEGPGLDDEQLAHIFERFYRTDSSRARASGGVGLGLSIVDAVVRAHGGRASASSTPGEGTTVRLELPLARAS